MLSKKFVGRGKAGKGGKSVLTVDFYISHKYIQKGMQISQTLEK